MAANEPTSTLVHKDFPAGYKAFLRKNDIKHHVFDMTGTKKATIPPELMKNILQLVMDQRNYPLLIHCNHGRVRTLYFKGSLRAVAN